MKAFLNHYVSADTERGKVEFTVLPDFCCLCVTDQILNGGKTSRSLVATPDKQVRTDSDRWKHFDGMLLCNYHLDVLYREAAHLNDSDQQ